MLKICTTRSGLFVAVQGLFSGSCDHGDERLNFITYGELDNRRRVSFWRRDLLLAVSYVLRQLHVIKLLNASYFNFTLKHVPKLTYRTQVSSYGTDDCMLFSSGISEVHYKYWTTLMS